jgi:transposase
MVNLTTADISDSAGAQAILDAIRKRWPWVKHLIADGAYDRGKLMDKAALLDFVIEIVRRVDAEPWFKLLPRRWVVERTFGWMTRWRRLVRDYEHRIDVSAPHQPLIPFSNSRDDARHVNGAIVSCRR